jgi:DNA (cytosine-5)-methyltransferase 1
MIKFIDLFAGIGGIRIAFEENGAKCVGSSEIDQYACKTYFDNFGEMPLGDITKIEAEDLPDFDIITAGFPCQPFSLGGLRKGFEDTRGTLFFEVARLIAAKNPKAFFLENVEGIVNHDKGKTLQTIEKTLKDLGYCFDWRVMNAYDYGIPQNRKRWYCVGFKNDMGIAFNESVGKSRVFVFPPKCDLQYTINDIVTDNKKVDSKYTITETCSRNIQSFLGEFVESKRYNPQNILLANEIRPSRCNFRCDGISPCLTAKMGTGGNNVPVYVKENRKLTERECLKIMSFPDWYKIEENSMHSYKQIGNSVVVSIVSKLAKEMIRVLS